MNTVYDYEAVEEIYRKLGEYSDYCRREANRTKSAKRRDVWMGLASRGDGLLASLKQKVEAMVWKEATQQ